MIITTIIPSKLLLVNSKFFLLKRHKADYSALIYLILQIIFCLKCTMPNVYFGHSSGLSSTAQSLAELAEEAQAELSEELLTESVRVVDSLLQPGPDLVDLQSCVKTITSSFSIFPR